MSRPPNQKNPGGIQPQLQFPSPQSVSSANAQMTQVSVQDMFQQLQNTINSQAVQANQTMGEIKNSIDALKMEIVGTKKQIQELSTQMENIATNVQETEERVAEIECQNITITRDLTKQEVEVAAYNIRIQRLEHIKGEDVYEIATDCLSLLANFSKEEMRRELALVYRMHTAYTR